MSGEYEKRQTQLTEELAAMAWKAAAFDVIMSGLVGGIHSEVAEDVLGVLHGSAPETEEGESLAYCIHRIEMAEGGDDTTLPFSSVPEKKAVMKGTW